MRLRNDFWLVKCFLAGSLLLAGAMAAPVLGLHGPDLLQPRLPEINVTPANAPPMHAPASTAPASTAPESTVAEACSVAAPLSDARVPGGSLVIAGGGYVTDDIRQRFVELAGGARARIVVIPASDPVPGEEERWLAPWRDFGVASVEMCNAGNRDIANSAAFCAPLTRATGVWFSGGYQEVLATRYVDTAVQQALRDLLRRNGVIGGCSAGAAILSRVMIEEGEVTPVEARGLGLISNAIVDQHLLQRNRIWRLQQMLEAHPHMIGLGIDERTALVVEVRTWRLNVIGESYALVCLPSANAHPTRMEVLKSGDDVLLSQLRQTHFAYRPPVDAAPLPVAGLQHASMGKNAVRGHGAVIGQ